jgi:hypothetical protein
VTVTDYVPTFVTTLAEKRSTAHYNTRTFWYTIALAVATLIAIFP